MMNKKLRLLNTRRKIYSNISLFVFYIILILQYVILTNLLCQKKRVHPSIKKAVVLANDLNAYAVELHTKSLIIIK